MAKRRAPSTDPAIAPGAAQTARAGSPASTGKGGRPAAERSFAVRVRPGAGRTRVGGRYDGPHGPALIVAVGAPAVDGKATEAVRRALAAALGLRPGDVELKIGATSRDKVFTVAGDVGERLAALRDGTP
ncbi:hypothetical protein Adi01nite_30640 [Amorphoplanes digitatis]|uniref:UPF0235 protein BJ971_006011 n=1 Tax=Actinoplanes digitatis TaxID=1868 RepID=A0A7W7MT64_9ACTN|nr:uncharacterized protein YggU (UPF0235/DUF167 family) [Actinoplanes digitatis]BFE75273.1 hypothetical protein GCM10020092_085740 [Actinoplanes digitatis]GID93652.1 hypothetical protein Adi01nite_30640 [Actinoplanes digitatis]